MYRLSGLSGPKHRPPVLLWNHFCGVSIYRMATATLTRECFHPNNTLVNNGIRLMYNNAYACFSARQCCCASQNSENWINFDLCVNLKLPQENLYFSRLICVELLIWFQSSFRQTFEDASEGEGDTYFWTCDCSTWIGRINSEKQATSSLPFDL